MTTAVVASIPPRTTALHAFLRRATRAWPFPLAAIALALYGAAFLRAFNRFGLFRGIGTDWSFYWAQARELRFGDAGHIYDLSALSAQVQVLAAFSRYADQPMAYAPVPYVPLFAWLFQPFTLPDPGLAFSVWTALTLTTAVYLARRAALLFPAHQRLAVALLVFTSAPVIQALYIGQPALLIGAALGECYLSLRAGRDWQAGLWLACLSFKPQYGILLGPLLVWKTRWMAALGAGVGVAAILAASLATAGVPALMGYPASLAYDAGFRGGPFTHAELQVNWRSLVLAIVPGITENRGQALTAVLAIATLAATVAIAWRSGWNPRSGLFPVQISATVVATLLVTYQSHTHGLALLIVPLAAVMAQAQPGPMTRGLVVALLVLPVLAMGLGYLEPGWYLPTEPLTALLLLGLLAALLRECVGRIKLPTPPTHI
jgi:hypothetical protein